jgi:N-acetylglutamate synthase-like GNAT family acetyltransferase
MAVIRRAGPTDNDRLVSLINAAFAVERFFIDADRIDREGIRQHLETGEFLVAELDGSIAGCAYLEPRGDRGYLGLLSVNPAHQGMGLGRTLVEAAEARSRELGFRCLELRVVNLREELPAFYCKLGYRETGTEPFPPDVPTKLPCHLVNMSKDLDGAG